MLRTCFFLHLFHFVLCPILIKLLTFSLIFKEFSLFSYIVILVCNYDTLQNYLKN
jgi:hypothetical protein